MFRVRLASGEEAVYRSVDELALGVQSGMVTSEAEIFHGKSQRWLPIVDHPEYGHAVERATSQVAVDEFPAGPSVLATPDGLPQVYQMFSRSARELADRKRRPRWHFRLAASAAGVVLVGATALALRPDPQISDEVVFPHRATSASPAPVAPSEEESALSRRVRYAPYNLANRFSRTKQALASAFSDSVASLGLSGTLRPARLATTDSLRRTLAGLTALAPVIIKYQTELREVKLAYRDTSAALIRGGNWTRSEAQEWRARILDPEPPAAASRLDSLLGNLTWLYTFLLSEPNRVDATSGFIPGSDSSAATYDRLRTELTRLRSLTDQQYERAGVPLRTLLALMGTDTLPARQGF